MLLTTLSDKQATLAANGNSTAQSSAGLAENSGLVAGFVSLVLYCMACLYARQESLLLLSHGPWQRDLAPSMQPALRMHIASAGHVMGCCSCKG